MRKILLALGCLFLPFSNQAQVCDFDTGNWGYSINSSTTGTYAVSSASPAYPAGSSYGVDGTNALTTSAGKVVIDLDPISTLNQPYSLFSFRLAANAQAGAGKGMDSGSDYVKIEVKTSTLGTYRDVLLIKGYSNALWGMSDRPLHSLISATQFTELVPFDGGHLEYGAPGAITIIDIPKAASVEWRITLYSDRSNEIWSIDDIEMTAATMWTNALGDSDLSNGQNWSSGTIPNSNNTVYLSDTSAPLPSFSNLHIGRMITYADDTLHLLQSGLTCGEWVHIDGVVRSDEHTLLTDSLGYGELSIDSGSVIGSMSIARTGFNFRGWRHMAIPLATTWGDATEDFTNVLFGVNGSIYSWDAGNAQWFSINDGSYSSDYGAVVYGGPGFLDSSNHIKVQGELRAAVDTAWLQYGVPSSSSPFPTIAGNEGWNLIANPYPFPIHLDELFSDPDFPSAVSPTAYIWSTHEQAYRSYNLNTGPVGSATPLIAPWQSFWVQMTTNASGLLPMLMKSTFRANGSGDVLRKVNRSASVFSIEAGHAQSELRIAEVTGADLKFEPNYDHRQRNTGGFRAYFQTVQPIASNLSLKSLDPNHAGGIPLMVESDTLVKIEVSGEELDDMWWLEDRSNATWVNLKKDEYRGFVGPNLVGKYFLWRKRLSTVDDRLDYSSCETPRMTDALFVNESGLDWTLHDLNGREVLHLKAYEQQSAPKLKGIYIWRSSNCSEKVFLNTDY